MSALIVAPDHIGAIIARLRDFPEIMALCADEEIRGKTVKRVSGQMQPLADPERWTGHALLVVDAGGPGGDLYVPFGTYRVDVLAYGSTGLEASKAARTALAALVPAERRGLAFTAAGCRIVDVRQLTGLLPVYDADIKAHVRVVSYEVLKSEEPVTP